MIRSFAIGLLGGASLMSSAMAGTCVGVSHDVPFPGATGVETLRADVPSALFPGLWQQGLIDGFAYQIFANTTGVLRESQSPSAWSIAVDCQQSLCIREVTGSPPDLAWNISQRLELCLAPPVLPAPEAPSAVAAALAPADPAPSEPAPIEPAPIEPASSEPTPSVPTSPEPDRPEPDRPEPDRPEPAPPEPAPPEPVPSEPDATDQPTLELAIAGAALAPTIATTGLTAGNLVVEKPGQCDSPQDSVLAAAGCRPISLTDADPVVTLQRLLVLAGADPGPVDGAFGPRTQQAVLQVLGFAGRNLDVADAIAAVDAYLCRQAQ